MTGQSSAPTRQPYFRTLREEYLDFVGGNLYAALLLDYLVSIERAANERRAQGETVSEWYAISETFGGSITLLSPTPSKATIRAALALLMSRGLIAGHPDNGQPTPKGERPASRRYRLVVARLLQLEADWRPTASAEGSVTQVSEGRTLTYPGVGNASIRPSVTQVPEEVVVGVSTKDSNEDEDTRARSSASPENPTPAPERPANAYAAVFTEWEHVGGLITPQLRDDLVEFTNEYGAQWVCEAITGMGRSGVRTPNANYLRKVLEGWRRNGYGWRPNAPAGPNGSGKPHIPSEQVTGQTRRVRPEDIPSLFKRPAAGGD